MDEILLWFGACAGMNKISNERYWLPRILGIVETPVDGFEALSPLELGEPQVVEEQVMVVLVQVEARLGKESAIKCQANNSIKSMKQCSPF